MLLCAKFISLERVLSFNFDIHVRLLLLLLLLLLHESGLFVVGCYCCCSFFPLSPSSPCMDTVTREGIPRVQERCCSSYNSKQLWEILREIPKQARKKSLNLQHVQLAIYGKGRGWNHSFPSLRKPLHVLANGVEINQETNKAWCVRACVRYSCWIRSAL